MTSAKQLWYICARSRRTLPFRASPVTVCLLAHITGQCYTPVIAAWYCVWSHPSISLSVMLSFLKALKESSFFLCGHVSRISSYIEVTRSRSRSSAQGQGCRGHKVQRLFTVRRRSVFSSTAVLLFYSYFNWKQREQFLIQVTFKNCRHLWHIASSTAQ